MVLPWKRASALLALGGVVLLAGCGPTAPASVPAGKGAPQTEAAEEQGPTRVSAVGSVTWSSTPAPAGVPTSRPLDQAGPNPSLPLPVGAQPLHIASGDLDGDGREERVVLAGFGPPPEGISFHYLELLVHTPGKAGWELAWRSGRLIGERGERLRIEDVNGDGRPEVLSVQSMGASGQTLYLFIWLGDRYGILRPKGGHFDGSASFGENSVRLADVDGDGVPEIHAGYGPVSSITAVYRWDGQGYLHLRTIDLSEQGGAPHPR